MTILPTQSKARAAVRSIGPAGDEAFPTFFRRDCETCLTPLHIHVEHLGEHVSCPRCGHGFTATDSSHQASAAEIELQRRVTQFLWGCGMTGLQQLRVELHGRTVVLRGRVPSARDRWLCANCCARVAGVLRVIDELEIEESVAASSSV